MKFRLFPTWLAATGLLMTLPARMIAEETPAAPAAHELTLAQCIQRALARNFNLEIQRETPVIAADAIVIAQAGFQPVITLSTSVSENRLAPTSLVPAQDFSNRSTRLGVSQELTTGTTVGISSQLDRSRSDPATSSLNPAYDADLTFAVRQQLLQGFGTAVNTAAINRARLGLSRARLDYQANVLDVIRATEGAYYDVVFARGQLGVRQFTLTLAQRLHEDSKTRKETGVATELDVLSAEVGVANAHRGVLLARQAVKDTEERLLSLIGQFELDAPLGSMSFAPVETAAPAFASSLQLAQQNQPDLISTRQAIDQVRLDLIVARDRTRPDLSLGGAIGLNGRRTSSGSAIGDALDRENHSWQLDLSLTYPWGQTGNKARFRQTEATLRQFESTLRQFEQNVELQVRSAVRAVETNTESVRISAQARTLSDRQYELEKARFDAGLSTSYRVLQAQNDLETARVSELQAVANLHNSLAALHRIEGSSFQRYGITLP